MAMPSRKSYRAKKKNKHCHHSADKTGGSSRHKRKSKKSHCCDHGSLNHSCSTTLHNSGSCQHRHSNSGHHHHTGSGLHRPTSSVHRHNHVSRHRKKKRGSQVGNSPSGTLLKDISEEQKLRNRDRDNKEQLSDPKVMESPSKSRTNQALRIYINEQKRMEVKNRDPDQEKMKRLLLKLKREKESPKRPMSVPMDGKAKLLMDRIVKKPYPLKYMSRGQEEPLMDEKSSFFKVSGTPTGTTDRDQKADETMFYDQVPKLENVLKMNDEKVMGLTGVPFWAEYTEPTDQDMVGVEPPISVGSDHLEMFNDRKLVLKTVKDGKVILDVFHPMSELVKRDNEHFHPHLVFSNTVRSLINVQCGREMGSVSRKNHHHVTTPARSRGKKVQMTPCSPDTFKYERSDPIRSAHEAWNNSQISKTKCSEFKTISKNG